MIAECSSPTAKSLGGMTLASSCILAFGSSCSSEVNLSADAEPVVKPMVKFASTDSQPSSNGFFCDLLGQGLGICAGLFPGSENPLALAICTLIGILNDSFCVADTPTTTCGDNVCAGDEATTCPQDCTVAPTCGNNTIDSGEVCDGGQFACPGFPAGQAPPMGICSDDCKTCLYCGDGTCNQRENSDTCPQDCQNAQPVCGNGILEGYEQCDGTAGACPQGQFCDRFCFCGYCGDGECTGGEGFISCGNFCPADCPDVAPTGCDLTGTCDCSLCNHDGICQADRGETAGSCSDCDSCGDGQCTGSETPDNCSADCFICGDGICNPLEQGWCPDCGVVIPK